MPYMVSDSPAVSITGLRVKRGKVQVFDGLDLDLAQGRVTGLMGPSGCGKSTLIRCIVGIQKVQAGSVTVLGLPAGAPSLRRRVSYSSQQASVYTDLSVGENIAYFTRLYGLASSETDRVISAVGLADQRKQRADDLSGGQLTRTSLAIALLGSPELLVLDEPTVGLDPVLRAELWGIFRDLADSGIALIVSSHVMDEANRCDDLLLMRQGQIVAYTTPADLLTESGKSDPDEAFLELIRRHADAPRHRLDAPNDAPERPPRHAQEDAR
jgi:ABC-2 type transport system ATP-binding protein